ncbi:3-hydroxyacyl-CoA dehydrogenase NAD-binding domain-containing protein [uncultured Nocardioides sp.]|uniref:3-hydroxyacyl-CoA dehydrogenase NAD-binding domain-containing protein n=1 Tax=uncultured Nocardioides sp. TaxID=198441 RepID=UPI00342A8AB8
MDGLDEERRIFREMMETPQRTGLIHAFFNDRKVAKLPEIEGVIPRDVGTIGVIGGGTMGAGIATSALLAGIDVTLAERDDDATGHGGDDEPHEVLQGDQRRGALVPRAEHETGHDGLGGVGDAERRRDAPVASAGDVGQTGDHDEPGRGQQEPLQARAAERHQDHGEPRGGPPPRHRVVLGPCRDRQHGGRVDRDQQQQGAPQPDARGRRGRRDGADDRSGRRGGGGCGGGGDRGGHEAIVPVPAPGGGRSR